MQACRAVPFRSPRGLAAWFVAAGVILSAGCSAPEDLQAPDIRIATAVVPTSGLVGEWKLDETSGTTAADTKNGYNASVLGGAAFIMGTLGNALDLNNGTAGTGGKYAQMPSNATLDNVQEGNYTISAWFYPYSVPIDASISNRNWAIVAKAGQTMGLVYGKDQKFTARHYLTGDVLASASSSGAYAINTWYHVAGVVSKTGGTVRIYVNGTLVGTSPFQANTAAREYGTRSFQIGKAMNSWAANGRIDQVRIYNRALTDTEVSNLRNETAATFRFPVGMAKGTQSSLLGAGPTPDGHMTTGDSTSTRQMLNNARAAGARITLRVTGGNEKFQTGTDRTFVLSKWKAAFDDVAGMDVSGYVADGTLIGHYAIDEPFADFDNMTSGFLELICQYQKSFAGWSSVPCIIRDKNTRLYQSAPTGGYQYVDAGWAQLTDHHYVPPATYGGDIGAYFRDNLDKGRQVGLGLMYGFNLINGGVEFSGCAKPGDQNNCAMTATEVRAAADTLAAIGNDQGCGVIGWTIDASAGPERDYFFGTGVYSGNGIQSALQYLNTKVAGLRPGSCGP